MDKIFVLKKGKYISGPYNIADLQATGLKESDKVWYEGLHDWEKPSILGQQVEIKAADPAQHRKSFIPFWKKK